MDQADHELKAAALRDAIVSALDMIRFVLETHTNRIQSLEDRIKALETNFERLDILLGEALR